MRLAMALEEYRTQLLILLGACHKFSSSPNTRTMSSEILNELHSSAEEAIPLLAGLLVKPQLYESEFRYLLVYLAAVNGFPSLASAIKGLDY